MDVAFYKTPSTFTRAPSAYGFDILYSFGCPKDASIAFWGDGKIENHDALLLIWDGKDKAAKKLFNAALRKPIPVYEVCVTMEAHMPEERK